MAEVFRATLVGAEGFARPVAIKRVLPGYSADSSFAEMLKSEARIASLLTHPNIVSVLDFDRDEQQRLFLVMELVEGKDLYQLLKTGPVPISIVTFVIHELLRALSFAHSMEHRGQPMFIVHRDVSPHNVLLAWSGAVKLSDFGIAKAAASTQVTATGVVKGKVAYLSPEQALAQDLDGRSDLFAVGIMLYEMLTGARLFGVKSGAQDAVIVHRVLTLQIGAPRLLNPEISPQLEAVCLKLLERDRRERFQTAEAALEALLSCPDMSKRGALEMAELLQERFPREAPPSGSWQSFAANSKATPSPSKDRPALEYGGFSAVEDYEAPKKGRTRALDSSPEQVFDQTSAASERSIREEGFDWKTGAMYALLGLCAVTIALLGWRVWLLYFGSADPSDKKTPPRIERIEERRPQAEEEVATPTVAEGREEQPVATDPPPAVDPQTEPVIDSKRPPLKKRARSDRVIRPEQEGEESDRLIRPDL